MKFKTTLPAAGARRKWLHIDATNAILGRLATRVATILMGKHKPDYATNIDSGDYVIVTNCEKIVLTGNKKNTKTYKSYSGYLSGEKEVRFADKFRADPTFCVREAVRRMLPKTNRGRLSLKKLKLYAGSERPNKAQNPVKTELAAVRKGRVTIS